MELPSKVLEQVSYNAKPKIEEHMLIVMNKSTDERHLCQLLKGIYVNHYKLINKKKTI